MVCEGKEMINDILHPISKIHFQEEDTVFSTSSWLDRT